MKNQEYINLYDDLINEGWLGDQFKKVTTWASDKIWDPATFIHNRNLALKALGFERDRTLNNGKGNIYSGMNRR